MFSLMGKSFSCLRRKTQPKREITLAILGLDNAGKTTATKALLGEPLDVAPTVGFVSERVHIDHFDIKIFDLGGGKKIRKIWRQYLTEVYGVIFVVDSSAPEKLDEVKEVLKELLENDKCSGKPILLLANKQDQPSAMDEVDICEKLSLEHLVNTHKCPCRIETCSAIKGTGKKMDQSIKIGLKWICATLDHNWGIYQPRVEENMLEEAARKQKELEAKRERVRIIREERERKEEEERERLGIEKPASDEEDMIDGDPFKRVNVDDLKEKERRMKEEKRKKKELELKRLGQDTNENNISKEESDDGEIRSSRTLKFLGLTKLQTDSNGLLNGNTLNMNGIHYDSDQDSGSEITTRKQRRATPRLPPLQKPMGTKFSSEEKPVGKKKKKKKKLKALQENEMLENDEIENMDDNYQRSKHFAQSVSKIEVMSAENNQESSNQNYLVKGSERKPNKHIVVGKTLSLDDTEEEITPRLHKSKKKRKGKSKGTHQSFEGIPTPRSVETEENSSQLESSFHGDREERPTEVKKLKKKAYLKNNKTAPSDDEIEMSETLRERDLSWTLGSPKRNIPVLSSDEEPMRRNWGFAEDLGDTGTMDMSSRRIGVRPNFDDDNDIL